MRSMEFSGKSIDEAVFLGLQAMGIAIDAVDIEVVRNESKGILGIGAKSALVRLTEKPPESILEDTEILSRAQSDSGQKQGRRDRDRDRGRDRERGKQATATTPPAVRESRGQRENRLARQAGEPREPREAEPAVKIEYSRELAQNNEAAKFLEGLLTHMGMEAQVLAAEHDGGLRLRIDSSAMGLLIGHRGETLDAMQYLTSLVVNRSRKENGYQRVTLDTENYRNKREESLRRLAHRLASQVRASGKEQALEPMNPYERRILHAALQNSQHVTTHSEGEEPNRRIIISPKNGKAKKQQ